MEAGHGISLVTGFDRVETLREIVGVDLPPDTRRGSGPPSCAFVGIVVVVAEVGWSMECSEL